MASSVVFRRILPRLSCGRTSIVLGKQTGFAATRTLQTVATATNDAGLIVNVKKALQDIETAGTHKKERIITSPQKSSIYVSSSSEPVLNFCANNYLGLSDNKELITAAKDALDKYGNGLSSVRFICGTQEIHKKLEKSIAEFHGKEDSILFPSCFDANGGLFETLLTAEDAVISDELNHASIIDGIRLCKAQRYRYKHLDMGDLRAQLEAAKAAGAKVKMIVSDGVFSMDGDIAPLDKICDLADEFGALVMLDECHATGFVGKTGRGTPERFGVTDRIDIINSTLGKALGGAMGGYTTARQEIVDLLRQRARPYLFSNSLPPAIVGSTQKVFDIISKDTSRRDALERNTKHFRSRMTEAGFTISGKEHPISPVMLYDAKLASDFANDMLAKGIYVIGFSFPVVPKGQARIRVQLSAAHTPEEVDRCVDAFVEIGKKRGVIGKK